MENKFEPKIFIIIPIYNKEKFLYRCLQSVQNQTYKNFEAILVDDGSKDGSRQICKQFTEVDNRFKYVYQNNSGVSVARNTGIGFVSSGSFFSFLDADDWVDNTYCEKMLSAILKNDADMAFCKINYYVNGERFAQAEKGLNDVVNNRCVEHFLVGHNDYVLGSACRILYKYDKFSSTKFNENLHVYEDLTYLLSCFYLADKLCLVEDFLYNYDLPQVGYFKKYFCEDLVDICYTVGMALHKVLSAFGLNDYAAAELFKEYCLAVDWICNSDCDKKAQFKILKLNVSIENFNSKQNYKAYQKLYSVNGLKGWLIYHKRFMLFYRLTMLKRKLSR